MSNANGKIKVLVVDDSAFMRSALTRMISSDPDIQVIGTARDGVEAVDKTISLKPDVVTLDIEMPRMNGLEALRLIMDKQPTPVLMISSYTTEGAIETIKALELGAVDFIPKNISEGSINILNIKEDIINKIKQASGSNVKESSAALTTSTALPDIHKSVTPAAIDLIIIGSSTGGPRALQEVIPRLPKNLPVPVLVAQHMPPNFTKVLAERLNELSKLRVKEAEDGEMVLPGKVLIAPGGKHMIVKGKAKHDTKVKIIEEKANVIYKPSVDMLMISASELYPSSTLGVILTGMGHDGLEGARRIKKGGGKTIAQDKDSCTIYGMPKAVIDAGLADKVVPLSSIAYEIINSV